MATKELDPRVKEAFELAAKEIGVEVRFQGLYVYVNEECPEGTEEKLAKSREDCKA